VAYTAAAVLAMENEGHFPGGGTTYSPHVEAGLDFIFNYARTYSIGPQTAGDPDTNGDGVGVGFYDNAGYVNYETGMVMQAIVASNTPDRAVTTGPLSGSTYREVMENVIDFVAWGQADSGAGRGGWRYSPNAGADNSFSQWPVLGLVAAEQWGISAPQFVRDELEFWVTYIQNPNGGSGYADPNTWVNQSKTGGLLVEFYYLGDDQHTARAQAAINFLDTNWNGPLGSPNPPWDGNLGHPYAMFSVFKGLELMNVATIPNAAGHPPDTVDGDWWGDYADNLVNSQNADGSWTGFDVWNPWLATGWYIVILQATVFPVECSVDAPTCACDLDGYQVDVHYAAERFAATGTLEVYKDSVLYDAVTLTDFMGSATETYTVASDTPGPHDWYAILDVTGGETAVTAEDTDTVNVCETPQVAGIPDQVMPFVPFDLDDYTTYGGVLPINYAVAGVPAGWTAEIDVDNVCTVTAPAGVTAPADLTFTASVTCCSGLDCDSSDVATFSIAPPGTNDITALVNCDGDLRVYGNEQANEVAVFQLAAPFDGYNPGDYVVLGGLGGNGSQATVWTTINGGNPYVIFRQDEVNGNGQDNGVNHGEHNGVNNGGDDDDDDDACSVVDDDVNIYMFDGGDAVGLGDIVALNALVGMPETQNLVNALPPEMQVGGLFVPEELVVKGNADQDLIGAHSVVVGEDAALWTGASNPGTSEAVAVVNSTIEDDLQIKTSHGDDLVAVGDTLVGEDMTVHTFGGSDGLIFGGALPNGATPPNGTPLPNGTDGRLEVAVAVLPLGTVAVDEDLKILTGAHDDYLSIFGAMVGDDLKVFTSSGDDLVEIDETMVDDVARICTAGLPAPDADTVFIGNYGTFGIRAHQKVAVYTGDDNDVVDVRRTAALDMAICTYAGDDTVVLEENTIGRILKVKLSIGDDLLDADPGNNTVGARSRLNGGPGQDTFDENGNDWGRLRRRGFDNFT
jgi:hypothetical protein